ncbi:transposase [Candidatus Sarmatiella mevalonica]|uniref:transposase n=1 Tax=Candidatus Sarmatiella mevalonica TaxID=2770581 RepID=UPI001FC8AA59|nr:transposase [Candidatus Sarmatiella mevalonica]
MPPHSPDLNSIEKFWANMKRWIKNQITASKKGKRERYAIHSFVSLIPLTNPCSSFNLTRA